MVKPNLGPIKIKSKYTNHLFSIQHVELQHLSMYEWCEVMISIGYIPCIRIWFEDEILRKTGD